MRGVRIRLTLLLLAIIVLLSGCGQRGPLSSRDVFAAFEAATLCPTTITPMSFGRDHHLHYREWVGFSLPETKNGGMLIVCARSEECDDVFLWLSHGVEDAERKPSFLRSRDGTVLVQLSPSLSPALRTRYEEVIKAFP
jgi:hypothetical protein